MKQTNKPKATLWFSDNRPALTDLEAINETLRTVGVRLSHIEIPREALPILNASVQAKLSESQTEEVLEAFALNRDAVLEQIHAAGRTPVLLQGGDLSTGEIGVAPYPKVYDLKSLDENGRSAARNKFGRLHVNSTDEGIGVDEVMTLVSGGPFTWYFRLNDGIVAKLSMERIPEDGAGFRLSYPGLTPHGALMSAEDGVVIAHITGPKTWTMRYNADVDGAELLGTNPWIDFSDGERTKDAAA